MTEGDWQLETAKLLLSGPLALGDSARPSTWYGPSAVLLTPREQFGGERRFGQLLCSRAHEPANARTHRTPLTGFGQIEAVAAVASSLSRAYSRRGSEALRVRTARAGVTKLDLSFSGNSIREIDVLADGEPAGGERVPHDSDWC